MRLSRFDHHLPKLIAAAAVTQVDLVIDLAAPARTRQDHGDSVDIGLLQPVILQLQSPVAKQRFQYLR